MVTVSDPEGLKGHLSFTAAGESDASKWAYDEAGSVNKLVFKTKGADGTTYDRDYSTRGKIHYVKATAPAAPAAPTAEELENVYGAVTFGGDAQATLPAYLEAGYYTPAKAVEKQADGTYTFTVTVPNTKDAAAKYLEQKGGSADDLEYDDKASTTTVTFAYDAAAKAWNLKTPAKLVLNKKPAPAITKDNFDFTTAAVRVRDDESDDTLDTLALIEGTYDLSKLDMTKYTNVGGALVIDLPITNAQKYVDAYNEAHPDTYYALAGENAGSVVLRYYQGKWGVSEPTSVYVKQGEKPASKAAIELNATSATVSEYGLTKLGDLGVNTWVKKVTLADGTVVSADDYWKTTNPVIKDASGNEHTLADGLKPGEYTITYTLDDGSATATLKLTVTASTYDLEAQAEDNLSLSDAKKLASNKAFIDKYVTKAQTGDGEDFKGDVTVSVYKGSVDPNNHLTTPQFAKQVEDGGTYIVVFEYDPDHTEPYLATAQTTLTIGAPVEQAPAFDAQQKLNTAGIVELEAVDENGNKLAEDTTGKSVNMLYGFPDDITKYATVTKPEKQEDGTWKVVATLDATKLPADVVRYLDSSFDPSQFELDTTASKLTVEFQTGTGKFDKNFYSSTGNLGQHAKLVFKKKAAERTQVMLHVHGADANDQGIEDLYPGLSGQKLSEVKGFEESPSADGYTFEGWYTQPDGQGEKVTGDTVLPEGTNQFNIYAYWTYADTYTLSVPAEQTVTPEVAQGLRFAEFSEYVKALGATGTRNGQPVDPNDDFWNVHVTDVNGNGTAGFGEGKEGTYKVTFTLGDQTAVSLVTVKAAPAAPEFNLDTVANYAGNVTVRTVDADGSQLAEDTTGYSLSRLFGYPEDISKYAKATTPEQQADGTWKVTVTFDASKLDPADVLVSEAQWGDASQYEFDAADSQQTITFQTEGNSTQYYAQGSATVTYKKKAEKPAPQAPAFDAQKALNTSGSVTIQSDDGTGKGYVEDRTFTYVNPEDIQGLVKDQGKPALNEQIGNWEVTLTLDPAAVKAKANPALGDDYQFVADDSNLTVTFETNGAEGTQWYVKAFAGAKVSFKKQAAQPEVTYELAARKTANVTPADAKTFKTDADFVTRFVTKATADGKDDAQHVKVSVSAKDSKDALVDFQAGKEGSYTVTFTLGDKTATTAVTIKANNGGGNGGGSTGGNGGGTTTPTTPSYKVVLPETIDGGSVETNGTSFKSGATVTVKPASKEGYRLVGLKVTDKDGKQLTITDGADGAYAFEMPSSDVTLEPVFTKVEPKNFADVVDGQWYKPGVDYASANGLMNGYGDSNDFGVGKSLTRGELAALLFNNAKPGDSFNDYRLSKNQTGFADVEAGQFYTPAANWAVKNQVVNGYADAQGNRTGFGPNDAVTLEQLLAILSNYADKDGANAADTSVLNGFVDGGSVDPWAAKSVAWAVQKGLIHGYDTPEGKRLDPIQTISRERVATVLLNAKTLGIL